MLRRGLYAFASDFIRLEALLEHGGLYLDTDVEILQDPRKFLRFSGLTLGLLSLQNRLAKCSVATNWISSSPRDPHLVRIHARYQNLARAIMNNTLFTREIIPLFQSQEIPKDSRFEYFEANDIRLYHPDFFNPVLQREQGQTVPHGKTRSIALHHGVGAWFGKQDPDPLWRRIIDFRPDRKILRPIERQIKRITRKTPRPRPVPQPGERIPRILHYVWLGGQPLTPVGQRCLQSWQKFLSGWEIRRWDESNSPVTHPFVKKMMLEKKYAFASDYIRLFALASAGGLYLDTDLELVQKPEPLLRASCVLAFLSAQNRTSKNSAGMGFFAATPGHPWVEELKQKYDRLEVAVMNTTLTTQSLRQRGLAMLDEQDASQDYWELGDIRIYHSDYFYPELKTGTESRMPRRAFGIHHAEGSWHGQAAPLSPWKRFLDFRLDRKILRPIEQKLKKVIR